MRVLVIHPEPSFFAGAERMLAYYIEESLRDGVDVTLAAAPDSPMMKALAAGHPVIPIADDRRFSILKLVRQWRQVHAAIRKRPPDVIHGWAARDWELTALVGRALGRPAVATLHDHPKAGFLSSARQRIMRQSARFGLRKIICVSDALRDACANAGYAAKKLAVVRNGLPVRDESVRTASSRDNPFRIGYLGLFLERKGFRGIFETLDRLAQTGGGPPWELLLAGSVQGDDGQRMVDAIHATYATRPWWPRVRWEGWVDRPQTFLASLDALLCPSSEFDPFPTVVLEAGRVGVPALGARVGGIGEMIVDGETGWLFEPQDWDRAAELLRQAIGARSRVAEMGRAAARRVATEFTVNRMVAEYRELYKNVAASPHRRNRIPSDGGGAC